MSYKTNRVQQKNENSRLAVNVECFFSIGKHFVSSFFYFFTVTSALLSLQLLCEAREDANNTTMD